MVEPNVSERIEVILLEMNKKLDILLALHEKDCKKMSNHIDFVENIYDKIKTPFTFIMDSVKNIIPINRFDDSIVEENLLE